MENLRLPVTGDAVRAERALRRLEVGFAPPRRAGLPPTGRRVPGSRGPALGAGYDPAFVAGAMEAPGRRKSRMRTLTATAGICASWTKACGGKGAPAAGSGPRSPGRGSWASGKSGGAERLLRGRACWASGFAAAPRHSRAAEGPGPCPAGLAALRPLTACVPASLQLVLSSPLFVCSLCRSWSSRVLSFLLLPCDVKVAVECPWQSQK